MTDSELLHQFTQGSHKAFAELVQRHVDLVFATALRHLAGDRHAAEDVVQKVFIDLARKARTLTSHPTLVGWLHSSTRYAAINTVRSGQRRFAREQQSDVMNPIAAAPEPRWEQIRPAIDDALLELDEADRQSILLRFFGQQPFAAIAAQLGMSENAAQKRVDRSLDRLSVVLKRRGISSTAVALGLTLAESCVAAPATLAGAVTSAALANAASLGAGTFALAGLLKMGLVVATLGIVGWSGVKWLRSIDADKKPVTLPVPLSAKSASTGMESNRVVVEEASEANAPIVSARVERSALKPAPIRKIYVVRGGDTLNWIASSTGVTSDALRAENPGYDFVLMRVGDEVFLPARAGNPSPPPVIATATPIPAEQAYFVEPGDSLAKIAKKRDLLPDELKALNPEMNWSRLRVGQRIRAPWDH